MTSSTSDCSSKTCRLNVPGKLTEEFSNSNIELNVNNFKMQLNADAAYTLQADIFCDSVGGTMRESSTGKVFRLTLDKKI